MQDISSSIVVVSCSSLSIGPQAERYQPCPLSIASYLYRHRIANCQAMGGDRAIQRKHSNTLSGGFGQGLAKGSMGSVVGFEMADPFHLNDEDNLRFITVVYTLRQVVQVFYAAFSRSVGEQSHAVFFQGYTFDFNKDLAFSCFDIKIKTGAAVFCFRLDKGYVLSIPPGPHVFSKNLVGRLAVHVDQLFALPNGRQIIFCSAL